MPLLDDDVALFDLTLDPSSVCPTCPRAIICAAYPSPKGLVFRECDRCPAVSMLVHTCREFEDADAACSYLRSESLAERAGDACALEVCPVSWPCRFHSHKLREQGPANIEVNWAWTMTYSADPFESDV